MKFVCTLILLLLTTALWSAAAKTPIGTLEFRLGDIQVKSALAKKWQDIDEGDKIFSGDTLKTGKDSKCEAKLLDGSVIRYGQNALYVFGRYDDKKGTVKYDGKQLKGQSWTNVNKKDGKKKDYKVKSPVAVAAVIGTVFKFGYDGSLTEVAVLDGQVNVDLDKEKKEELNLPPPEKETNVKEPGQSMAPKEIPGPYEVTLNQWISIVKGEIINIRSDGKYSKTKSTVEELEADWESFDE